ncbi:MAG: hypothetical protein COW00_07650 [Bdellovibrio sp. CG12_big_fil_rev_8_21_14_0_65_39_13]|nr:MAG: hypothetical protein COW78_12330 [Bdellovibrio sp. CG22_combo_CG10-13_8_21_14_all_39_27]PIQ60130.1 MAG: hypothetical protein COW00_07650 [Bdellovibrio sp. CG12_big_fil_rev_8_21_14_0_65_39_13]PIR36765.1 MAG: hypothetical protein COV37_01150 [Bdellovibrio sp. CG11_big_fil_rev_8_21_14_0_20_39_38]PJB52992.1 MAG: hypothetical protein CO099_09605 [Bdellovibrio sp. CG_4_9_14_3_um_filter_39_7]
MTKDHSLILNSLFFVVGLLFFAMEILRPDRKIDRKLEFKKDLLAFGMLILSGVLISAPLMKFYQILNLPHWVWFSSINSLAKVLIATIVLDFFNYWIHLFMHKWPWFWKGHLLHHKIEQLYWFSGLRASFVHYASFIFSRATIGVLLFNLNSYEMLVYLVIGYTTNFYQHTNARIGHRWIEWVLVTPRVHRLHHSVNGRRMKNIGTIFSFWDRWFGTWLDPEEIDDNYKLGVRPNSPEIKWNEVIGY